MSDLNNKSNVLYRYETSKYNDPYESASTIDLKQFSIIKETPKGYWIWNGYGIYENYVQNMLSYPIDHEYYNYCKNEIKTYSKWVSNDGRKRYAYPTKTEAQVSFQKRKEKQIKIIRSQLTNAENDLRIVNKLLNVNK